MFVKELRIKRSRKEISSKWTQMQVNKRKSNIITRQSTTFLGDFRSSHLTRTYNVAEGHFLLYAIRIPDPSFAHFTPTFLACTNINPGCPTFKLSTAIPIITLSNTIKLGWSCIIEFLHPPAISAMRYTHRMRTVAYAITMAPIRILKRRESRIALADSLNSPVCVRIRAQTSEAIRPNIRRVKTCEARPAIITLFPAVALEPPAAKMAPIL